MIDHLPECYLSGPPNLCPMCEALRDCEQRVEKEWTRDWDEALSLIKRIDVSTIRMKALREAREAVAAVPPIDQRVDDNGLISLVYDKGEILAAIDALRGSGNPHTPPSAEKGERA